MTKILLVLVIAYTFEAFGVIILKQGIDQIGPRYTERKPTMALWKNVLKLVGDWFTNKNVLIGLLLETVFFVMLQYLLGQRDVSFVWPLTALSYVMTTLAAQFFLKEHVDVTRWGGVALIIVGAVIIGYGEHSQKKLAQPAPASAVAE